MSSIPSPKQRSMVTQIKQITSFDPLPSDTRDILLSIFNNIIKHHPDNAKFCQIKLENAKFKEKVLNHQNAMAILKLAGFVEEGGFIKLPHATTAHDIHDFHLIVEMLTPPPPKRELTPEEKAEAEKMKLQKQKEKEEKAKLKEQLEANKKCNKEKEVKSSKAQKIGGKSQITRYKDIGVDLSSQGG